MLDEKTFKKLTVALLILFLLVLSFIIIRPIFFSVVGGLILTYIFFPVYKKVLSVVREKNISAVIVILIVLIIIFIPFWFLLPSMIRQILDAYLYAQKINVIEFMRKVIPSISQIEVTKEFALSVNTMISTLISKIISAISSSLSNLPSIALNMVIVIFTFFFGMRDGELFKKYVASLSPFSKSAEADLSSRFKNITKAVIFGYFVVGIIQGIFTGLGLWVFGVPQVILLTVFAMLASLIPMFGAWLIWIPSSIYLIVSGHAIAGIGLALYGALFVSWIDNILRIYLLSRQTKISSAIVIIGMFGGLAVFGFLGLILGPLILSYLLLLLDAYRDKKFMSLFSEE